jgi:uncharacterized protein (DUF4415 family)
VFEGREDRIRLIWGDIHTSGAARDMSGENITRAVLTQDGTVMIEQPDGSYRKAESKTDWQRVNALSDAEIEASARDDGASPLFDDGLWANAHVVVPTRIPKKHQGMRLDVDVIDWFRAQGPGWQTRMNAVLRSFVEAQKRRSTTRKL